MRGDLTNRETDVLNLVAQGASNKMIAGVLEIAEQTVKNHMSMILIKLRAKNRAHAVAIAKQGSLI
jgi:DNA-binding NarL/FixJ family response regulator